MPFEDLPAEWPEMPLTDTTLGRDVVDLFLRQSDRVRDSMLLLVCDDAGRAQQPLVISDMPWHCPTHERDAILSDVAQLGKPGVVIAISARRPIADDVVDQWHHSVTRAFADRGVVLHGFYCADLDAVWDPLEHVA